MGFLIRDRATGRKWSFFGVVIFTFFRGLARHNSPVGVKFGVALVVGDQARLLTHHLSNSVAVDLPFGLDAIAMLLK